MKLTIVFNMGGSAPGSDMGNLGALFGMSSATDANIFTGENFFYFVESRPVIERALLKECSCAWEAYDSGKFCH